MTIDQLRELIIAKENPSSVTHSARTGVAAVVSLLIARLFRIPEAYWAAITTLIVMQSIVAVLAAGYRPQWHPSGAGKRL